MSSTLASYAAKTAVNAEVRPGLSCPEMLNRNISLSMIESENGFKKIDCANFH